MSIETSQRMVVKAQKLCVEPMAVSFAERVRSTEEVLVQEIRGEVMFLNLANETYYGLDPVGSRMYQVLINSDSIQSAYTTLEQEYDVEGERLRRDIEDLITKLLDNGLIKVSGLS